MMEYDDDDMISRYPERDLCCVDAPFCSGYLFRFNFCRIWGPFGSDFEFEFGEP